MIGEDTFGRVPPGNVPFSCMKSTQTRVCSEVGDGVLLEECSPNQPPQASGGQQGGSDAQESPLAMPTGSRYGYSFKRKRLESSDGHLNGFLS